MSDYIKGKVVAITGAGSSRGFGAATAAKLAALGAKLVIADRQTEWLEGTYAKIKEITPDVVSVVADVGKYADNQAIVKAAIDAFGRLDVFIANAGTMPLSFWSDAEVAMPAWDDCIDTNLKGVMYGIAASRDALAEHCLGQFIVISSIYGNTPVSGGAVYQCTKIGVRYLVNSLRQEEQGKIKTTIICPTGVPSTRLMKTVVNRNTYTGGMGCRADEFMERAKNNRAGNGIVGADDVENPNCEAPTANEIADGIVYSINQPAGVSISDLTIRAKNELFML